MEITYSKQRERKKQPYINFRMRKLIFNFMFEKCGDRELAQSIADKAEAIVSENFWVKDKRGVNVQIKKVA